MVSEQKIKVVFVITSLGTGGAQMMLYKMLTRLDMSKFEPAVVTLIPGGMFAERVEELNVPVHDLGMQQGMPNIRAIVRLRGILKMIDPKIVQGWMYHGNLMASFATKMYRNDAIVYWSVHQSLASIKAEKKVLAALIVLSAKLSKSVKAVVFSAVTGREQHIENGFNESNSLTIRDNFDLKSFPPQDFIPGLRESLSLPDNTILVGSVARYAPMKDHANLLDAIGIMSKEFPAMHFVLIGPGVDENTPALVSQITELGISGQTHLLGERHDVPQLLPDLDVFVLSSAFSESFPNVLGEAMACHVPCISTDVGDAAAIVGDQGLVVPPRDSSALAEALREFASMSAEERKNLGQKARLHIENNFNLDDTRSFVRQYEELYLSSLPAE